MAQPFLAWGFGYEVSAANLITKTWQTVHFKCSLFLFVLFFLSHSILKSLFQCVTRCPHMAYNVLAAWRGGGFLHIFNASQRRENSKICVPRVMPTSCQTARQLSAACLRQPLSKYSETELYRFCFTIHFSRYQQTGLYLPLLHGTSFKKRYDLQLELRQKLSKYRRGFLSFFGIFFYNDTPFLPIFFSSHRKIFAIKSFHADTHPIFRLHTSGMLFPNATFLSTKRKSLKGFRCNFSIFRVTLFPFANLLSAKSYFSVFSGSIFRR